MIWRDNAVVFAPVAGYSDLPGRNAARRHGCAYAFTEMVDAGSITFGNPKSLRLLERGKNEKFLGVQLVGSDPEIMKKAVNIINSREFDVLDFNLGCPAPKVAKKGEGITLALERPELALRLTELLVKLSKVPVTVKTRIHDYENPEPTVNFLARMQETGIASITLHGRVKNAFYSGKPSFKVMKAVAESIRIPLIVNGGVMGLQTYNELRSETGCDKVMLARGALGNPWIFEEIEKTSGYLAPNVAEFTEELMIHAYEMLDCYGLEYGFSVMRKTLLAYLSGRGYPGSVRAQAAMVNSEKDLEKLRARLLEGPSSGYWVWLDATPDAPAQLRK